MNSFDVPANDTSMASSGTFHCQPRLVTGGVYEIAKLTHSSLGKLTKNKGSHIPKHASEWVNIILNTLNQHDVQP